MSFYLHFNKNTTTPGKYMTIHFPLLVQALQ